MRTCVFVENFPDDTLPLLPLVLGHRREAAARVRHGARGLRLWKKCFYFFTPTSALLNENMSTAKMGNPILTTMFPGSTRWWKRNDDWKGGGVSDHLWLLLSPPCFQLFFSCPLSTLLTRMTGISLQIQWPLTSQSYDSFSQREQLVFLLWIKLHTNDLKKVGGRGEKNSS
jgi:hypothetical protein